MGVCYAADFLRSLYNAQERIENSEQINVSVEAFWILKIIALLLGYVSYFENMSGAFIS